MDISISHLIKSSFFLSFFSLFSKVHITQGSLKGDAVIISWITVDEPGSSVVHYGTSQEHLNYTAKGKYTTYEYYNYTSGYIHHTTIRKLKVRNSIKKKFKFVLSSFFGRSSVRYKILLCCWSWSQSEDILVHYSTWSGSRCTIYLWPYRLLIILNLLWYI